MSKPSNAEIYAMAIAQIHIGVAMARVKGVVCGAPRDIRIRTPSTREEQ